MAWPLRLLAADYGADITYREEIIDHKFIKCERRINGSSCALCRSTTWRLLTFWGKGPKASCLEPAERNRVVFQIGTSDAIRALKAAPLVCKDVTAVDVNMGCPKSFSISKGMDAALLSKPETIHEILTTLKRNLDIPVACKILLLKTCPDTVELARRIEKAGVSALAVHGRRVPDRPRDFAKWNEIGQEILLSGMRLLMWLQRYQFL
ncbi:hypothetical protein Cgig2_014127 [Carnegiea gigantea]|uniref:DUS-like FMN-binding domain-containing protein n=1 Tax=Carnegiea gigantea TaxID=171969 RepID=A0A9Q1Q976_9CARY|nr:hypothetical protein Cgig2_014127 [Carnegiea gigantea]